MSKPQPRRVRCAITACPEKGDRYITPKRIKNLPDAPPMLMCKRHADMAEAANQRKDPR